MKKLLALVLALVMTLGLATVGANAADFKDQAAVEENEFYEAIEVLHGMDVFRGNADGEFMPDALIDRASTAAMIYRIYTGDVKDNQVDLYKGYGKFTDLPYDWYKGYIGYCANAEFIKGDGNGKFYPDANVTGYQALAMVLRAIGYNKQNDFTGDDWELRVAEGAQQLGLVQNVSATTLKAPATRALVAEIIWEGIWVNTVTYTPAFGYSQYEAVATVGGNRTWNPTLGWKNFRLGLYAGGTDDWGRPLYTYGTPTDNDAYATFAYKPTVTYTTAVSECDVAHDLGRSANATFTSVVNAEANELYNIRPTVTDITIGAQGRLTEVYDIAASATPNNTAIRRIVMIDTFLAKVTKVEAPTFDKNDHLVTPALLTLEIYTQGRPGFAAAAQGNVTYKASNGRTPWKYAEGDYVLLNAATDATVDQTGAASIAPNAFGAETAVAPFVANTPTRNQRGSAADFEVTWNATGAYWSLDQFEILGLAESFTGAQTVITFNNSKHTIAGKEYNDALEFHKDDALNGIVSYTWFLDLYGNLIGSAVIDTTYTYGVITALWWVGDNTTGGGYAAAQVTYMDGTSGQVKLGGIKFTGAVSGELGTVSGPAADGVMPLRRAVVGISNEMLVQTPNTAAAYLPVSTYAWANEAADALATRDGIIYNDLFRFNETATGLVIATETGSFAKSGATAPTAFNKGLANNGGVVTNDNTVFLVKNANNTFTSYKGRSNLPGNYAAAEIDWVNINNDVFAEYVFLRGNTTVGATVTTFVLTSPVYTWNLNAAGTAIEDYFLTGYINGVLGTLTIPAVLPDGTSGTALVTAIINGYTTNPGTAWILATRGGKVVAAVPAPQNLTAGGTYDVGNDTEVVSIIGAAGDAVVGGVYVGGGVYYTGADTKPLTGEWAADMSTKNVTLEYKTTGGIRQIIRAYIFDRVTTTAPTSGNVTPTTRSTNITWTINYTVGAATPTPITVTTTVSASGTTAWTVSALTAANAAMQAAGFTAGGYTVYAATIAGSGSYNVAAGPAAGVIYAVIG